MDNDIKEYDVLIGPISPNIDQATTTSNTSITSKINRKILIISD